ncbi:MAG: biotin transporter BioY [Ignavibacteriaceae bacterium]|jgi:biotin transport system substrate-specific component
MFVRENVKTSRIFRFLTIADISGLIWILSFTILTAIAAQITIPVKPVPFTFQTTMVILSGAFLGARNGAYSQFLYLMLGCLGIPVFAQIPDNSIGIARLFGPTGGYLLAFPVGALISGYLVGKLKGTGSSVKKYTGVFLSFLLGEIIIISLGALFLSAFYLKDLKEAFIIGAAVFMIWTVAKVVIGTGIYFGINKGIAKFLK